MNPTDPTQAVDGPGGADGPAAPAWIDSHCHLQLDDRGGPGAEPVAAGVAAVLERARAAGVERMVCVGTDLATSRRAVELAAEHADVWATIGLHPHDASRLEGEWDGLVELCEAPRVVGVGETGFDLHYTHSPRDAQEAAFRAQIRLAGERGLALVIHSRSAWDDTFAALGSEGVPPRTVFHCFTGGPAEAERVLGLGTWLSFSGIVSFRGADDVRRAAALAPPDRILVETDSPFLAPVPLRGRPNEPAHVPLVGAAVAEARGESTTQVAALTVAGARAVFWPGEQ